MAPTLPGVAAVSDPCAASPAATDKLLGSVLRSGPGLSRAGTFTANARDVDREEGLMRSKRQTTMAKLNRERKVQERRELKREKKQAAAAARNGQTPDGTVAPESVD